MSKVFMWVMCSEEAIDAHRFADVVDAAVARGDAPAFPAFERWAKKTRERPAPKNPLEPREKKKKRSKKGEGEGDLAALILGARRDARAAQAERSLRVARGQVRGKKGGHDQGEGRGGEEDEEEDEQVRRARRASDAGDDSGDVLFSRAMS